ncbi:GBS Bsp-like repeat-containing protein [Erysipelatoclostridium ramosum]|nr:GBS Bsp-like repeat-containing protein [Thomasclavelia ramosa]MCB6453676.1 GBS Bsp-like repeat-containing protein [Thomasclavelia ramosa]MCB7267190.1 GBS Bsp-like repeat-containing protein [Thomasclavelia ramosa]MCB7429292.1 GBS Bsp-like repeat-containing protein [Thomasclavelia ramosa]
MKKKVAKVSAVSLITLSMTVGNVTVINGLDEKSENHLNHESAKMTTDVDETKEEEAAVTIDGKVQTKINESINTDVEANTYSETDKVIGQTNFVDENGNIKTVEVYDGTTGEVYNPLAKTVVTANMINFNCRSAGTTTKYIDYHTGQEGYLSKASAADAAFLGYENGKVKFMISGVVGLVDENLVEIVPQGRYYASNYEVNSKGLLYHYISNNVNATQNEGNYNYVGVGPSYLVKGKEYYSYDGHYFYTDYNIMIADYKNNVRSNSVNPQNPYYNYFQYLPMRSKTNYTGAELTNYLNKKANSNISKLNNTGEIFVKYQDTYGVNALMAASFAALESGWGKSSISQNKNNLFGLNAVDSNPSIAADAFESVDACIKDFTSNWMSKRYLNATYTSLFRGGYFGDKGSGIFGKYSSDPYEGEKCASIAENMDAGIAGKDKNYYTVGIKDANLTTYNKVDVKSLNTSNSKTLYTSISNPAYAFIVRKKNSVNGYYEIQSDSALTSDRTGVSSLSVYNYPNDYGYVAINLITLVNIGNDIVYQENQPPKISEAKISSVSATGYTVSCKVESASGLDRVEFPTWTTVNGQDDITWGRGTGTKNPDGTYTYTYRVNTSEHGNADGEYNTHIYAYDKNGRLTYLVLDKIVLKKDVPIISDVKVVSKDDKSYTLQCKVSDASGINRVEFSTWTTVNGQDDNTWISVLPDENGIAAATISIKDHNYKYGEYETHIYVYDNEGMSNKVSAGKFVINEPVTTAPIISNTYITNATDEGFTISCNVKSTYELDRVEFAVWTDLNDQDDIIWYNAKMKSDVYSFDVKRSNHKYEYGAYNIHIYVYDKHGQVTYIPLNMHNVINTHPGNGWTYIDGQKYFYDETGTLVGNMPSKKVVDVSQYNGNIDWDTAKKYGDIDGAILRITSHSGGYYSEDKQFANNLAACRRLKIPFGIYIYDYANNNSDAIAEANLVISILKKYNVQPSELAYPVYYDLERSSDSSEVIITPDRYDGFVKAFISTMDRNGYTAHIYSYRSLLNSNLNSSYIWAHTSWMAAYTKTMGWNNPYYSGLFGWQYTSSGYVPGIGTCDLSCWFRV